MSYQDVAYGTSAREMRSYTGPTNTNSDQGIKALISSVFKLQTEVTRLKNDVDKLCTARDTAELRQRIAQANHRISSSAKDIKDKLMQTHSTNKTQQTTKILNDFEATLKDFQNTMKTARGREASSLPHVAEPAKQSHDLISTAVSGDDDDRLQQAALLEGERRQEALQLDRQAQYNEMLIDERDQGIADIQQQIGEVNEIFQDLAVLVNDQGQMIDDIEANITRTADRTKGAHTELVRAEKSQRSGRNKQCFLFLIAGFVLTVLLIVFLV